MDKGFSWFIHVNRIIGTLLESHIYVVGIVGIVLVTHGNDKVKTFAAFQEF